MEKVFRKLTGKSCKYLEKEEILKEVRKATPKRLISTLSNIEVKINVSSQDEAPVYNVNFYLEDRLIGQYNISLANALEMMFFGKVPYHEVLKALIYDYFTVQLTDSEVEHPISELEYNKKWYWGNYQDNKNEEEE